MKSIILTPTIFRAILGGCFVVALLFMQPTASAETILMIQYTGLDITYDGSTVTGVGDPDPLESVDFFVGGTKVFGLNAPGDSPLNISLTVPGVTNIPDVGGTVISDAGGSLVLTLPDGDFVNLALGEASVTYVSLETLNIFFLLSAGAGEVLGQLLPIEIDVDFGDAVAVSFSTNIDATTKTISGDYVTGFLAKGTGEIKGNFIPEPSSITLLLCGLASLICWRCRK